MTSSQTGPLDEASDLPVGGKLASLRRRAGLTGKELAGLVGMTQPKISRIETGFTLPDPADVRRIAEALRLSTVDIEQLVNEADDEHNHLRDWRPGRTGLAGKQREVGDYEKKGREVRIFQPTIIAGLLQTSAYARAVMATSHHMMTGAGRRPAESDLYEAVAGRMRRQETLLAARKRILVILTEAAFSNALIRPPDMVKQILHLRELVRSEKVLLGIIPADVPLQDPPLHGFELVDERWLIIDLLNTSVTSQGRSDIQLYRALFERMWTAAEFDVDGMLDKYRRRYEDLPP